MDPQVVKDHKIPRDQAVSSEPSSTRPNPFDDSDSTSRKRRRTSQSGSPARSIDTYQDISSSTTVDGDTPAQDSAMKLDSEPAPPAATTVPKTPEPHTASIERPPIPRSSSKVTINLRNSTIASSADVASQTPTTPSAIPPTNMAGNIQKSVEGPDVTMTPAPAAPRMDTPATPRSASSSLGSGSSDVEALTVEGDENDRADPEHSFAGSGYIEDPCLAMPFVDADVCTTPAEAVIRVCTALETNMPFEEQWYAQLTTWLESCVAYFTNVSYDLAAATYTHHQPLWQNVPSLFWITAQRKLSMNKPDTIRTIGHFYSTFMKLAAAFAAMDVRMLGNMLPTGVEPEPQSLELRSAAYFQIVLHVIQSRNRGDEQFRALDSLRLTVIDSFLAHPAVHPKMLISLAEAQIAMLPTFPRSAEYLYPTCQMLTYVVNNSIVGNRAQNGSIGPAPGLVMEFYDKVSAELPTILEKYLIHMSNENGISLVRVITDLYAQALRSQHPTAVERADEHRRMNPEISPKVAHEVISWRWRFDLLEKLIRSAQMQIRVQAVSQMCQDLVAAWKKFSEQPQLGIDGPYNEAYINYHAQHLLDSRLVDYILGPTCHPEIVAETGNIVGFLAVTKKYLSTHNDMLWQTMTSSQDPRIPDALLRMMSNILHLFDPSFLIDLCERMQRLPVDKFSTPIRTLSEAVFKLVLTEPKGTAERTSLPFHICLRLLRESFRFFPGHQVAHQDVADFALGALKEWAPQLIRTAETRQDFALQCIQDIAEKSQTTLGSLTFFVTGLRPLITTELQKLVEEHDLARLLIEELEHAIQSGKAAGYTLILSHNSAVPRRDLIVSLLTHTPNMIAQDLGRKLWDMLVGPRSASVQDRRAGWQILNTVGHKKAAGCYSNLYLKTCFSEYLPNLPPHCFCDGALEFLKQGVLGRVNDNGDFQLDDETGMSTSGIEQLWRMILTSNDDAISGEAIDILTNEVYIDSRCIMSYPHHRARQVHLALVNRCLRQLREAAQKLQVFSNRTTSGGAESMVVTATESQVAEQERIFVRSLALLKAFLQTHQSKAHFAAPDLRSYMNQSSGTVQGASAELKYQSFDGPTHTEIKPLSIGRQNTAAFLLASIREVTGFDNYRIYYRGQPFSPTESQVGRSLEELKVHDGLILVKREEQGAPPSARIKPGTSHLEIEILSHFKELWEYLSMDDKLAREIYDFLTKLPAHDHVLEHFDNDSTVYKDVFAIGQTFKCLYAAYALKEYLYSVRRRVSTYESESDPGAPAPESYPSALSRVLALMIAAITDSDVIGKCQTIQLQLMLSLELVGLMDWLLQEMRKNGVVANVAGMSYPPLDRFLNIIESARGTHNGLHINLITKTLSIVLDLCFIHPGFWRQFQESPRVPSLIESLLLVDSHPAVREMTAKQLESRIIQIKPPRGDSSLDFAPQSDTNSAPAANSKTFTALTWSTLVNLVPRTAAYQSQSGQLLRITYVLAFRSGSSFSTPSLLSIAQMCCELLLGHTTTEQLGQASPCDEYANGLVKLLRWAFALDPHISNREELPDNLALRLFRKHLFPAERQRILDPVPRAIMQSGTRDRLYEIVISVMQMDRKQFERIITELSKLVPFEPEDDDPYAYDLSFTFERSRHIRASCGYVGLRNLSNTCYLNSLLAQLFMNTRFREFMTTAMVDEDNPSQRLVHHTQVLFAHMQETLRRFVDPTHLVHSIKTYDDTMIDIHNQMDVDEFYNLLFDRWESQLSTQEERKGLRSFYGGQLVQQVMSKECDHVSERLESFQAIQCDIKGKTTLQESLQAYVDGEIMEGDNKYKCSTCDRHVDAVKRACLKDIPDNLIFHLKRFDFNLRTLQRAKINDYFAFPNKIDMRPYTIDHITNPQEAADEDMFELVGVLVHAGTAESGHYYSYARERPSTHAEATWIEFNDDVVTPWDPVNLEASTFGGTEYRAFEHPSVAYEKSYSAYMLFYQRSSSLTREQDDLRHAGLGTPLQVQVPMRVSDQIRNENTTMLRRHCLYDLAHITFVEKVLQLVPSYEGEACSRAHDVETSVMRAALGHLDQVVTRTKETPDFEGFVTILDRMIHKCPRCACATEEYFAQYPDVLRMLVQKNPDAHIRASCAKLWVDTLRAIKAHHPALYEGMTDDGDDGLRSWKEVRSVARTSVGVLEIMWDNFHSNIRSWREVFGLVLQFARLGTLETMLLLADDWLYNTMRILWVDPTMANLPQQFTRMLNNIIRRMTRTTPNYDSIIALIDHLQSNLDQPYDNLLEDAREREALYNPNSDRQKLPWTTNEVNLLHYDLEGRHPPGCLFVEKLVGQNQAIKFTDSIVTRFVQTFGMLDAKIASTLASNISYQNNIESDIQPYLRAAVQWCLSTTKSELVGRFLTHVTGQARLMANYDGKVMVDFFRRVINLSASRYPELRLFEQAMECIPRWAPILLVGGNHLVRAHTEEFLNDVVFRYDSGDLGSSESEVSSLLGVACAASRQLGFVCVQYLDEKYIGESKQPSKDVIDGLDRILARCANFYPDILTAENECVAMDRSTYEAYVTSVLQPLSQSAVDYVDEEGSDWDNSAISSDQMDELNDLNMHGAGEPNDTELP